jgi:hypothetical protein
MSSAWNPKFNVGDCIKWADYEKACIVKINEDSDGRGDGYYTFEDGGMMRVSAIDKGLDAHDGLDAVAPATLLKKGGKSNRRKSNRRKSNRRKSNRRKSTRRR